MRCGTRDGRTLSRRKRLDPRLLVVNGRHAAKDRTMGHPPNGAKAARGALLSAHDRTLASAREMRVRQAKQGVGAA